MARVMRSAARSGMKMIEDIRDHRGRVLVPAGAVIEEEQVRAIKLWGQEVVFIHDAENPAPPNPTVGRKLDAPALRRVRASADHAFRYNDDHQPSPFLKQLMVMYMMRLAGQPPHDPALDNTSEHNEEEVESAGDRRKRVVANLREFPLSIEDAIAGIRSLPTPPDLQRRLHAITVDANTEESAMAKAIAIDPGLTARLLRTVNDPSSGTRNAETVSDAVPAAGRDKVRLLAIATPRLETFAPPLDTLINLESLCRHSLSCGAIARILAEQRGGKDVEKTFAAGLLHDIGRIVIFADTPEVGRVTCDESTKAGTMLHTAEKAIMGFDHADLGKALLAAWNLPAELVEAVGEHHRPGEAKVNPTMTAMVHVADFIANAMRMGRSGLGHIPALDSKAVAHLKIEPSSLGELVEESENLVSELMGVFAEEYVPE